MHRSERIAAFSLVLSLLLAMQSRSSSATNYYRVGCFEDKNNRAMPKLLGSWRLDSKAIQKCAQAAENAGYLAFGVQYAGECWSGPQAHMTFSKYGASSRCLKGTGGNWAQDVYIFNASSISGNYDVKRCYKVKLTFHYKFPGGLTSSTIEKETAKFANLFSTVSNLLGLLSPCSGVSLSREAIVTSPPGESSVFFRIPITFTASKTIGDDQVDSQLTSCINELVSSYKGFLDSNAPRISQGGVTKQTYNVSTISKKQSCCGGSIPPPCCAAGAIKVSSTRCECLSGFHFVSNSLCARCPANTYQEKRGQTSCNNCPAKQQTFGKTGMTSKANCSDTNPLQLHLNAHQFLPHNTREGTLVGNVTVTGSSAMLVRPFMYYIDRITQTQLSRIGQKKQSRTSLNRRRRDDDDVCEDAGTTKPNNYFCIYRMSGNIRVSQGFVFVDGEEYQLVIRVTDSDPWGKTENTGSVTLILRDKCKEIRGFYDDAVTFCHNASSVVSGETLVCPSVKCLQPLFNWQKALNASSEALKKDCSFDPQNMEELKQKYSSCIGPPTITLNPVSKTVAKGAATVLTCSASSTLQVNITWFKNGHPIGFGSQLQIDSFQNDDQGDYYCKFSTDVTSSFSKPALLLMKDALTSIVSFTIVNKKYKDDLSDPSSPRYSDFQVNIQRNLENYFNSVDSPRSYQVELIKFRDLFGKVGVDLVVYSSARIGNMTSYYSRLRTLLADNDEMNNLLKPLKVSRKSVIIRSATHCLPEKTGKKSIMGVFDWPLTVIGQNAPSVECPYGPRAASATRLCGGNFVAGGIWKDPDVNRCKYKSERTNKLNKLAKTRIDRQNVVKVTKEVKNLTSQADDMNEADAELIADVIVDVVTLEDSLNETAQDVVDVIDNVMNMKKENLRASQRSKRSSTKFIKSLDRIARKLPLSVKESSRLLVAPAVAILSSRADPGSFPGMTFAVKPPAADPNKLTPDDMVSDKLPMGDVQTSITLPEVMFKSKTPSNKAVKIGFVIYQNDKFFQPVIPDDVENDHGASSVMSRVVSSSVQDMTFDNLSKPVELVFEPALKIEEDSGAPVCVFWDFNAMGGLGNWSDRGCKLMKSEAGRVKCHCDHMTNFAMLFSASGPKTHEESHAEALSIISYVGCAISLVGLTLTLMTYSLFRNLRKTNQQPILMSLCVSLMLLLIVFIAGAGQTEHLIGCRVVAVLLHYFSLTSVMWMGVEGYNMYMSFVKVMATYQSKFMLKASVVAWGVPTVIVIITVSAATSYYGNEDVCVLYGVPFQAAQFGPILAIILINFVIFILAMRSLSHTGALVSAEKKSSSYQRARTSVAILLLLGLTWVFGALAISRAQIVFDYLFCIFNSLQGFLIFYFHCLRQQEVRNQWKMFLTGRGRLSRTETDSRTGYPKTISKGKKYEVGYTSNSLALHDATPSRKKTVTCSVENSSPMFRTHPDVVPAEV